MPRLNGFSLASCMEVKKKRLHSRGGCYNCKKRKAKCDEAKPSCLRCIKSSKECVYGKTYKFASARTFTVNNSTKRGPRMANVKIEDTDFTVKEHTKSKIVVDPFIDNPPLLVQNRAQDLPSLQPQGGDTQFFTSPLDNIQIYNPIVSDNSGVANHQLEDTLFDGASNLISDLNGFFAGFDMENMQLSSNGELLLPDVPVTFQANLVPQSPQKGANSVNNNNTNDFLCHGVSPLTKPEDNNKYINTINTSINGFKALVKESTGIDTQAGSNESIPYKSSTDIIRSVGLKAYPCPSGDAGSELKFDYVRVLNSTITGYSEKSLATYFNLSIDSTQYKYLKIFFTHIHLNLLPFSTSYINNAYINTFLSQSRNSSHLLYAILAIAAKYEAYQVEQKLRDLKEQKGDPENTLKTLIFENEARFQYHMKFRSYYLSSCLQSLETILLSKEQTLNNIESLLLTILILASDFSGLKGGQWRDHLNGARDLLVNYIKWGGEEKKRECSIELVIVWLWFYAMEVLAALSSPNGGTIHSFEEMDTFLPVLLSTTENSPVFQAMREFGFSVKCNDQWYFNMYLGYDECMIEVFNDLVYGHECIRTMISVHDGKPITINDMNHLKGVISRSSSENLEVDSAFVLKLLAKIQKARDFKYINNQSPYHIPHDHPLHPNNASDSPRQDVIPSNYIKASDGNYYSWIDLSQQLFADASLLRLVVSRSMDVNSYFVRDSVDRMLGSLASVVSWRRSKYDLNSSGYSTPSALAERYNQGDSWPTNFDYGEFLNYNIDRRMVMVQWPLYICGLCCLTPEQKVVIECCFVGLIRLGVGSGELSLKKLQRIWHMERSMEATEIDLFGDHFHSNFDDDSEIVDSVPFA